MIVSSGSFNCILCCLPNKGYLKVKLGIILLILAGVGNMGLTNGYFNIGGLDSDAKYWTIL